MSRNSQLLPLSALLHAQAGSQSPKERMKSVFISKTSPIPDPAKQLDQAQLQLEMKLNEQFVTLTV